MSNPFEEANKQFADAVQQFTDEFMQSVQSAKENTSSPNPVEDDIAEAVELKFAQLLKDNLGLAADDFNKWEVLWCMRPRFNDFVKGSNRSFGQWWQSARGWVQHRCTYCPEDAACVLGFKRVKLPSKWAQKDVMLVLAIDIARKLFTDPIKYANLRTQRNNLEVESVAPDQLQLPSMTAKLLGDEMEVETPAHLTTIEELAGWMNRVLNNNNPSIAMKQSDLEIALRHEPAPLLFATKGRYKCVIQIVLQLERILGRKQGSTKIQIAYRDNRPKTLTKQQRKNAMKERKRESNNPRAERIIEILSTMPPISIKGDGRASA